MGTAQYGGRLIDIMDAFQDTEYIWWSAPQPITDPIVSGARFGPNVSIIDDSSAQNSCSKKRVHTESSTGTATKACREKIRRDRLNERFLELCSFFPEKNLNTDKVVILSDAVRRLNQLRSEAKKLEEKNESLQNTIKSLKEEKMELREEKLKLKEEKERLEEVVKGTGISPPPFAQQAVFNAPSNIKTLQYPINYPPQMWQWVPPAVLDTSQDHVFRPPVA